jgi:hypothetical protein
MAAAEPYLSSFNLARLQADEDAPGWGRGPRLAGQAQRWQAIRHRGEIEQDGQGLADSTLRVENETFGPLNTPAGDTLGQAPTVSDALFGNLNDCATGSGRPHARSSTRNAW